MIHVDKGDINPLREKGGYQEWGMIEERGNRHGRMLYGLPVGNDVEFVDIDIFSLGSIWLSLTVEAKNNCMIEFIGASNLKKFTIPSNK